MGEEKNAEKIPRKQTKKQIQCQFLSEAKKMRKSLKSTQR